MLTSIRIQNFRSIRDAEVKLGQVNLFIGPNNSGKSNFLKGIEIVTDIIGEYPADFQLDNFNSSLYRTHPTHKEKKESIKFAVNCNDREASTADIIVRVDRTDVRLLSSSFKTVDNLRSIEEERPTSQVDELIETLKTQTENTQLYDINPIFSRFSHELLSQDYFSSDGSNIVSFLFTLSQNHRGEFRKLENDLASCLGNITSIGTPVDPDKPGNLKLKFFDQNDIGYWAEEVSEGVLYFLALLCIVHQPDPPKLLLLEEPEKGIHPRRIKEVMDFIFELAQLRNIQIILTSHSPYVVDHFADIPECISVFDREDGETVIRNAGDIITETNAELTAKEHKPIRYTDSLGEHWVSGFLGGVPV